MYKIQKHAVSFLFRYLCTQIKMCMHASNAQNMLAPDNNDVGQSWSRRTRTIFTCMYVYSQQMAVGSCTKVERKCR